MLEAGISIKLSEKKLLDTGNGKALPSIMNALTKSTDKAAFSNSTVDSMIRKIEAEYIKILTPFDSLIKKLDLEINEIKSRIQHCKEKHLVEEEIGFYNVLNSFINTQFKIIEKKLDVVDKKIKAVQSEKKMAADIAKKTGAIEEAGASSTLNPNSGVAIHTAAKDSMALGMQKAYMTPNAIKAPQYTPPVNNTPVHSQPEQNTQKVNVTEPEPEVDLPPRIVDEIEEVITDTKVTITEAVGTIGNIDPNVLDIYKFRKENEEEIFKTPNELGADYNYAYNSLYMKNVQSESRFYLDINTGRFWIRTFELIGDEWVEIVGNQPGIGVIGTVRIDANSMIVTTQLEYKYKLQFDSESNMPKIYRDRWDSEKYDQYIIDATELEILKQKCKI